MVKRRKIRRDREHFRPGDGKLGRMSGKVFGILFVRTRTLLDGFVFQPILARSPMDRTGNTMHRVLVAISERTSS